MTHDRGLWPILSEFGCPDLEAEDGPTCEPCQGTGTFGEKDTAHQCLRCRGKGFVPADVFASFEVAGHA